MCHSSVTSVLGGACACSTGGCGWELSIMVHTYETCRMHPAVEQQKARKPSRSTIISMFLHIVSYLRPSALELRLLSLMTIMRQDTSSKVAILRDMATTLANVACHFLWGTETKLWLKKTTVAHTQGLLQNKVLYIICNVCNYVICEPRCRMKMYEGEPCSLNSGGRAIWPQLYVMTVV